MKTLLLMVALAAFFYASPAEANSGREASANPCGNQQMLGSITGYFRARWSASHQDLTPILLDRWLAWHKLDDTDPPIVTVRVFSSPHQPTVAAVAARRFTNHLNGRVLVDVLCVVPTERGEFVRQYEPDALQKILAEPGSDA